MKMCELDLILLRKSDDKIALINSTRHLFQHSIIFAPRLKGVIELLGYEVISSVLLITQ